MNNPVLALVDWIEKQSHEIGSEIAFLMAAHHPSFDFYDIAADEDEVVKKFCQRIKDFSGAEISNIGFLVAFRAIFEFAITNKRGTEESWGKIQRLWKEMIKEEESSVVKTMINQLPTQKEAWIGICQDWNKFKDSVLSDENIEIWGKQNMVKRSKETDTNQESARL